MSETKPTAALQVRAGDRILVRQFRLRVVAGPDQGLTFLSSKPKVTLGTHRSTDFVFQDPSMSRFHCEISLVDGLPHVRDLGSRNKTIVEGITVDGAMLRDQLTLTLGRTKVRFEIGDNDFEVPLSPRARFGRMVGSCDAMRAVFAVLEQVAKSDATVLLQGETGTGKDLAAESLHLESDRKDGPFVVVDCGALPANLLESELFGHERGAFTGADSARAGAFELADGGTLFLDEIGELALDLQPKLLRAIGNREIVRLGSHKRTTVDVRVVAATNRNLRAEVNARRFRSDLYYRIAVIDVTLPPLRERLADVPELAAEIASTIDARDSALELLRSEAFMAELQAHSWPGNVRELRNYVERALTLPQFRRIGRTSGSAAAAPTPSVDLPYNAAREQSMLAFERAYVEELLRRHDGNASKAARAAGLARSQFYVILARCGLR